MVAREPIPTHCFALVVVERDDGRFLLVQERKHGQSWYLPAGRVDPGEDFVQAALRETLEESGLPVRLTGILRIEQRATSSSQRLRVFFLARPLDPSLPPKSSPDEHSLRAAWFTLDELRALPLRGDEVFAWCEAVHAGRASVAPLPLLTAEGEPGTCQRL
jgi:8-oxo-dGTP pyrophosphatase MutT (NUDIX family)